MSHYPSSLSDVLPEFKLAFEIAKNRQIAERKAEFSHATWWVGGFGAKQAFGDPVLVFGVGPDSEEHIAMSEELYSGMCAYAEENGIAVPTPKFSAGPVGKINWKKLIEIFLLIAPMFLEQVPTV
jgi:hypothetical protein